jgi:cytochrome b pre-mRNA-processing protein 3
MFLDRLFRPRLANAAGKALYAALVERARDPVLYGELNAPDTVEGRFELYTLYLFLLVDRLKGQGGQAAETSEALFETYVSALDHGLREMGVGDLSVGKKMRRLAEAFFGRLKSYEAAQAQLPDTTALAALLERTVYEGVGAPPTRALIARFLAEREALAAQPLDGLIAGRVTWSRP